MIKSIPMHNLLNEYAEHLNSIIVDPTQDNALLESKEVSYAHDSAKSALICTSKPLDRSA